MTQTQFIWGAAAIVLYLAWLFFFVLVIDAWIRRGVGRLFRVTIQRDWIGGTGNKQMTWKVVEPIGGLRSFAIECLQYVFLVPAVVVPIVIGLLLLRYFSHWR